MEERNKEDREQERMHLHEKNQESEKNLWIKKWIKKL
jgi:hypothetical protein